MPSNFAPGFVAIHGDRIEHLRDTVVAWLRDNPPQPLEQETFLVQSNGVAEWLKVSMAEQFGVCAGVQVTLPARFLWQAYRDVLGPQAVPRRSMYDRQPLAWRLMHLLPALLDEDGFAPLAYFLKDGSCERRLQLTQKLAGLYEQYQLFRADWLASWAGGDHVLIDGKGELTPLAPEQRWQARLWCALRNSCGTEGQSTGRADVHKRFVQALAEPGAAVGDLPRRIVVFGVSALPRQTIEALGALARHCQVIVAVPNPCRYHWSDIIDGRDLFKAQRRHQPHAPHAGDLSTMPFEQLHTACHPLLAGWGRQGRDFIRMLDEFDDVRTTLRDFPTLPVNVFSENAGATLLGQVQAAIRDMRPLDQDPETRPTCDPADMSLRFHVAHSAQREVEVLHDELLTIFERGDIGPRDVIVMVPDMDKFAPAIRAVFGQHGRGEGRHIPFEIADVSPRLASPLLAALDWLLRLPQQRCLQSEVRDLLDVPAIAARFGIAPGDLPRVGRWIEVAGVRWGLDAQHRADLDLAPAGEQNAWIAGIRRMLLGYASGADAHFDGIEPLARVGGPDAALAGALARFVDSLMTWRRELALARTPNEWGAAAPRLLQAFFKGADEAEQLTLGQLQTAMQNWLEDCAVAQFAEPVPVAVLREAWLGLADEKNLHQRFISGGVTFCTLMPTRALPYRVVCLIGMNDGDFPRRAHGADFDLLALPGMARPGDRSPRDDDRYLMLEALLSARDRLHVSWTGRNARDNSMQPPSVLVAQLREYLQSGWRQLDLAALTVEHFLQPFSRHYFEEGNLRTHAAEWRAAHEGSAYSSAAPPSSHEAGTAPLTIRDLTAFMRQPVKQFFGRRLGVWFNNTQAVGTDDEPFALDALEEYKLCELLLADSGRPEHPDEVAAVLGAGIDRVEREGRLPIGHPAGKLRARWIADLVPVRRAWLVLHQRFPQARDKLRVAIDCGARALEDWIDPIRTDGGANAFLSLTPSRLLAGKSARPDSKHLRADKLIPLFVLQLAASAQGRPLVCYLVGRDCIVRVSGIEQGNAQRQLETLATLWRQGMDAPLPTACATALAWLRGDARQAKAAYDGAEHAGSDTFAERDEPCLARLWKDYAELAAERDHEHVSGRLYAPLLEWVDGSAEVFSLDYTFQPVAPA
jgi:exodeoxyribonuclease V gamma subunit